MARFLDKLAHCGSCGMDAALKPSHNDQNDLMSARNVIEEWAGDAEKDGNPEAVAAFTIAMKLIDEKLNSHGMEKL